MKRSEKQALAFVRNAVNVVRSLSLSRQDGVSRPADIKSPSEIQGSKFPFAGAFSFLTKRATCGSHSFGDVFVFPLTEDDLHALTEVQKYVCRFSATLLPRYGKLSDRISVPLIQRPWHWRSSFHPL